MSTYVEVPCANCGVPIKMRTEFHEAVRQNGNMFRCVEGHANFYPQAPSPDKRRIRELEQIVDRYKQEIEGHRIWRCQWCDKKVPIWNVYRHLTHTHGFPGIREVKRELARAAERKKHVPKRLPEKAGPGL